MTPLLLALIVVGIVAMAVAFTWARHAYSKRKHAGVVTAYLERVRHEMGIHQPLRQPHPHGEDETREMPAIRNALDHIHTPTPPPQPVSTPMALVTFGNDDDIPNANVVSESDLPPQPAPRRSEIGLDSSVPMAPASSVNDFHTWREQDQAVAQLASQLADMDGDLWTVHQLQLEQVPAPADSQFWIGNYYDRRNTLVMNLANQLNGLSAPLAQYLEAASVSISGPGNIPVIKAGNRTISGATQAEARQLNADVITITAPIRTKILAELNALGKTGVFPKAAGERYWIASVSNQLCLFFATETEAQEYADKLNLSYRTITARARAGILAELAQVTDPGMSATLNKPGSGQDLPDFRQVPKDARVCGA